MTDLNPQVVKEKATELAFAARTVVQQLAMRDRTPEGFAAQELLEKALMAAIPDANPADMAHAA